MHKTRFEPGTCPECGAPIQWAYSTTGWHIDLDNHIARHKSYDEGRCWCAECGSFAYNTADGGPFILNDDSDFDDPEILGRLGWQPDLDDDDCDDDEGGERVTQ